MRSYGHGWAAHAWVASPMATFDLVFGAGHDEARVDGTARRTYT
ncbi:hypothetical protein [Nonomuraea insulae]|uniref:Uncharacterized protein n=1 Tax=Nonomuraea insulae TaxID=1616787 RepID=A0ABW1CPM9_9ACTN